MIGDTSSSCRSLKVVIVGGGISGLATAYFLQELELEHQPSRRTECTVIEKERVPGGKIVTENIDGLVLEGGPDSFLTLKPQALALCERLGLSESLIGTNREKSRAFVLCKGKLRPIPPGLEGIVPTRLLPFLRTDLISTRGKLRMLADVFLPARRASEDESLASFVRRRLGEEALDRIASPLMAGIYAGDAELLSMKTNFPQLVDLEAKHRSLVIGALSSARKARKKKAKKSLKQPRTASAPRPVFMTLKGGLKVLVNSICSNLSSTTNARIITGVNVTAIRKSHSQDETQYELELDDGNEIPADVIVLATPAYSSAKLLGQLNPSAAEVLNSIPYVSTATILLAYEREGFPHPLDGSGFVISPSEARKITACTWVSSKWPSHSPENRILLRCYVGRTGSEEILRLGDSELCKIAQDELNSILGIQATPVLSRVFRFDKAFPQYNIGHLQKLGAIEEEMVSTPGIFLTGAAYRGVGLPDCIGQAAKVASKVMDFIAERKTEVPVSSKQP